MKNFTLLITGLAVGVLLGSYQSTKKLTDQIESLKANLEATQFENDSLTEMYTELNAACQQAATERSK